MPTRSRATPLPQAASPGPSPNSVSAPLVRSARVHTNALACSVPTHWHTRLPIQTHQAHPGAHTQVPLAGRQAGRRHGTRRPSAPRRRLSACPSTRGSAVVNDAFDGGRICCARSERAPIIWKAEIRNTIYSAALWKQFPALYNPILGQPPGAGQITIGYSLSSPGTKISRPR